MKSKETKEQRKERISFIGRLFTRILKNKKKYTRKDKHKNKDIG